MTAYLPLGADGHKAMRTMQIPADGNEIGNNK